MDAGSIVPQAVESARGELYYLKDPSSASVATDDVASGIPVTPIGSVADASRMFWIAPGFRLNYEQGSVLLEHATIRLYQGGLNAESKRLVVRGEWEFRETAAAIKKGHAQPHWHFHAIEVNAAFPSVTPALVAEQLRQPDGASEDGVLTRMLASLNDRSNIEEHAQEDAGVRATCDRRIHFPMAARWGNMPMACRETPTDEAVVCNWFEGIVSYIRRQVEYAAQK